MSALVLELILWMLFAFFVGCAAGCLARRVSVASAGFGAPAVGMNVGYGDGRDLGHERSGTMAPPPAGRHKSAAATGGKAAEAAA